MNFYKTKADRLPGTSYKEVRDKALEIYNEIKRRTKRKPYIRSAYFRKDKIFFDYFWIHLSQKIPPERYRRLKYFSAAIELIRYSRNHPEYVQNIDNLSAGLHRFGGITRGGGKFYVQIKEHKRTGRKQLMSMFPAK